MSLDLVHGLAGGDDDRVEFIEQLILDVLLLLLTSSSSSLAQSRSSAVRLVEFVVAAQRYAVPSPFLSQVILYFP
jgi:hypothetical protein